MRPAAAALVGACAERATAPKPAAAAPPRQPQTLQDPPDFATPPPPPTPTSTSTSTPTPTPTSTPTSTPLPPPKPVTLPLAAHSTRDPIDEAIASGDDAFDADDFIGAQRQYDLARKRAPKRAAPIVGIARVAIAKVGAPMDYAAAQGNRAILAATELLRKAIKLDPTFGPAYVELGRALLLLGTADGAIDSLRKGVELLPDQAEAHSALGVALLATGHAEPSLTELARAVDLDPGSAARHGNHGTVLFMLGRVADALHEYEIQVQLADGDARAHSDLGSALLAKGELPRAERELRRAIALDGTRAAFHSNLGYGLQLGGKVAEAIAEYRAALQIDNRSASAWINLATALSKDPAARKDARAALEKARAIDPTDPRVKANLDELDALEHGGASGASRRPAFAARRSARNACIVKPSFRGPQ